MERKIIETIETLISERHAALKNHNVLRAVQIRNGLEEINVNLADLREGTKWNFVKP